MSLVTVLDASAMIALLDHRDAHHDRAADVLDRLALTTFAASTLSIAETLVGAVRERMLPIAREQLAAIELGEHRLQDGAAVRLAQLRAETGLKLPDCAVLHTAEQLAAGAVVTFDDRLAAAVEAQGIATVAR